MESKITEKEYKALEQIAKDSFYDVAERGGLEIYGRDSLDFVEVSVGSIKVALTRAYELGKKNRKNK